MKRWREHALLHAIGYFSRRKQHRPISRDFRNFTAGRIPKFRWHGNSKVGGNARVQGTRGIRQLIARNVKTMGTIRKAVTPRGHTRPCYNSLKIHPFNRSACLARPIPRNFRHRRKSPLWRHRSLPKVISFRITRIVYDRG